jgi:cell division protein FtsL
MARVFLVWLVLASCIGWSVYQMKYEVQRLEVGLARVNRQILADQEAIQILKAEWSCLNQPAHLSDLARRFLELEPVQSKQMVTVASLPTRRGPAATALASNTPAPVATPVAPAAKPSAAELDEEATTAPNDLPDEPPSTPDMSLLLVKGVPQ